MGEKRKYTKTEYFDFLFDLGFGNDSKHVDLAKRLHKIDYIWFDRMDENRMYDGIEIRKYYLSDDLGYMPDDIDEFDEYIFPNTPSVLEVLVGFANRLCRDILGWKVKKLIRFWIDNLGLTRSKTCTDDIITDWMEGYINMFGLDESQLPQDLWSQAARWIQEQT